MLEKHTNAKDSIPFGKMNMTGDGIQMACDVGAAPVLPVKAY
jgi:hypothetical protein